MFKRVIDKLSSMGSALYHRSYYRDFAFIGKNVFWGKGVKIDYPEYVTIEDEVFINDYTRISLLKFNYEKGKPPIAMSPKLIIGSGTYFGRFCFISCMSRMEIGKKVMFSDRCFVGDGLHGYQNKELAIIDQYIQTPGPISIGDGSWIGVNVSILPNVTIGKHCIIGANSVVTSNVPDYHIAAGIPAQIIRSIEFK